jgi:hypothetical protein
MRYLHHSVITGREPTDLLLRLRAEFEADMAATQDEDHASELQYQVDKITDELEARRESEDVMDTPCLPEPWWEAR